MHLLFNPTETKIMHDPRDTAQPYRVVDFSDDKSPKIVWFAQTKEEAQAFFNNPIPFRNKIEAQLDKFHSLKSVRI